MTINEQIKCKISTLFNDGAVPRDSDKGYVDRVFDKSISFAEYLNLRGKVKYLGVSGRFRDVLDTFKTPEKKTPAGFRIEYTLLEDGLLEADLVRDIAYGENGEPRPTKLLFSADCANPYEIETVKDLIANITTNPVIIYDRFLSNPAENVGNKFKTRAEVISEIVRIMGSSADISIELNNPFASDEEILKEVETFESLIPKYCLVVKVPHLGPLTVDNIGSLVAGELENRYDEVTVNSAFRSHQIALMLHRHGYRVNFTLMFESYQVPLALQARPSYINCFVRNRYWANEVFDNKLKCYEATGDERYLAEIRDYMLKNYYLSPKDADLSLFEIKKRAKWILQYREWNSDGINDGLDEAREALRHLKAANLPDTRLIICSLAGEDMYALTSRMLSSDEFRDMAGRVVLSVAPSYLAQFATAPDVLFYNKGFSLAAQKEG